MPEEGHYQLKTYIQKEGFSDDLLATRMAEHYGQKLAVNWKRKVLDSVVVEMPLSHEEGVIFNIQEKLNQLSSLVEKLLREVAL